MSLQKTCRCFAVTRSRATLPGAATRSHGKYHKKGLSGRAGLQSTRGGQSSVDPFSLSLGPSASARARTASSIKIMSTPEDGVTMLNLHNDTPKQDSPLNDGSDTDNEAPATSGFIRYPSIDKLSDAVHRMKRLQELNVVQQDVIQYVGTAKIHGCNCSLVLWPDGELQFQSRNRILTEAEDQMTFVRSMAPHHERIKALLRAARQRCGAPEDALVVLFGEWAGMGIQKYVGVANLPKQFFAFDLLVGSSFQDLAAIKGLADHDVGIRCILDVSPLYRMEVSVNDTEAAMAQAMECTMQVDKECPVAASLGGKGVGEGIVWRPADTEPLAWRHKRGLWFKTKGESHLGVGAPRAPRTKKEKSTTLRRPPARDLSPEEVRLAALLTRGRYMQGLESIREMHPNKTFDPPTVVSKAALWMVSDVLKEEQQELEAMGLYDKGLLFKAAMPLAKNMVINWLLDEEEVEEEGSE